ncbi:PL29 family lyase N-terminal domain-containing protein [Bacteroides sp. An19]|uniref:PL29 family lyase N-terminal domain-containing protein n=1 Tax=Bacteroides sp. An19 TaxID=1965580 RepID=UPI000B3AA4C5|nr:PL29 family lyase N-terminal domain-containing protein [Bacteroides sp. An19]OUP26854.1 hypothetical protein B5F25_19840 [Bacteroides sp. An19]
MKRFIYATMCIVSLCLGGCEYDDAEVWDAINDQEERIAALEEWQKTVNENIAALQAIVNGNDYITSVEELKEGDEVIGYTINFYRQGEVTIYNGKDGEDGEMPVIGVTEGEDGRWYWTVNGELMEDADGNPVCASGKDGEDGEDGEDGQDGSSYTGVTPIIKLGSELGLDYNQYASYLSVDGGKTWTQMNVTLNWDGSILEAIYDYGEYYYFQFSQDQWGNTQGISIPKYGTALIFFYSEGDGNWATGIANGKQAVSKGKSFTIRVQNYDNEGEWTCDVVNSEGGEPSSWSFTRNGDILECASALEGSVTLKFTYVGSDNSVTYYQITLTSYEAETIKKNDNLALVEALTNALGTYILNEDGDVEVTPELIQNTTYLDISDKQITSLDGLEFFTDLKYLDCSGNSLASLDVSVFSELTELYCDNCFSQSSQSRSYENGVLDLSANMKLQTLSCTENWLTELILPATSTLLSIDCGDNQLKDLDVSANTALNDLCCINNQLTTIDITNNTMLAYLELGYNQLVKIDVSKNILLCRIGIAGNKLTELNVSFNTKLTDLYCGANQLMQLDVEQCKNLQYLGCEYNCLARLNVSSNVLLQSLACGNQHTENGFAQQLILTINEDQQALWEADWQYSSFNSNVILADGLVHSSGGSGSNFGNGGVY